MWKEIKIFIMIWNLQTLLEEIMIEIKNFFVIYVIHNILLFLKMKTLIKKKRINLIKQFPNAVKIALLFNILLY